MKKLLLILAFVPVLLFSQTRKQRKALEAQRKADQQIITNFKNHIQFFETNAPKSAVSSGSADPAIAYIADQFKSIGLEPKGTNGYVQQFKIDEGKQIDPKTFLKVNGKLLTVKKDYFPLAFSASKSVTGMPAMALKEKGVPWFVDVKDWLDDDAKKVDSNILKTVQKEADRAALKGATALFLYNSSSLTDNVHYNNRDKGAVSSIPVIYITPAGYNKYFMDQSDILDIELNVAFRETIKNAGNVIGYVNNNAPSTVVIATAYDKAAEAATEITDTTKAIVSQDNLSAASMLIELARMLSKSKSKNSNYTFIAHTAEDTLSPDSKWLSNSAIPSPPSYIINLDKVAQYDQDKKLLIESYGTSAGWIQNIVPPANNNLDVRFDSSALQSRYSSIGQIKVPVVNFYTERTTADNGKINYEGELQIARFIYQMIEASDSKGKVAFSGNIQPQDFTFKMTNSLSKASPQKKKSW